MDTLIAGHRKQHDGPLSEALVVQERTSGQVEIDLALFDEESKAPTDEGSYRALVSRSFITIPADLMDQIVQAWQNKYPSGTEAATDWTAPSADTQSGLAAAGFVKDRVGR